MLGVQLPLQVKAAAMEFLLPASQVFFKMFMTCNDRLRKVQIKLKVKAQSVFFKMFMTCN